MKIFFSHGKESGPNGSKIQHLAAIAKQRGCTTLSIDYTDTQDPDLRVQRLTEKLGAESGRFLLVGSSMGGYVSLVAAESATPRGIFLLAPALYMPGYEHHAYRPPNSLIEIVHGWSDCVIPPENSIRFAQEIDCTLHLISGDHRLNNSLPTVSRIFDSFIRRLLSS